MSQPALPSNATPEERRAQLEKSEAAQAQPRTLAGWHELLGPVPALEEGEESWETFEAALQEAREGKVKAPKL